MQNFIKIYIYTLLAKYENSKYPKDKDLNNGNYGTRPAPTFLHSQIIAKAHDNE